jgi:hypothetical protein
MGPIERGPIERGRMKRGRVVIAPYPPPNNIHTEIKYIHKNGRISQEPMKIQKQIRQHFSSRYYPISFLNHIFFYGDHTKAVNILPVRWCYVMWKFKYMMRVHGCSCPILVATCMYSRCKTINLKNCSIVVCFFLEFKGLKVFREFRHNYILSLSQYGLWPLSITMASICRHSLHLQGRHDVDIH